MNERAVFREGSGWGPGALTVSLPSLGHSGILLATEGNARLVNYLKKSLMQAHLEPEKAWKPCAEWDVSTEERTFWKYWDKNFQESRTCMNLSFEKAEWIPDSKNKNNKNVHMTQSVLLKGGSWAYKPQDQGSISSRGTGGSMPRKGSAGGSPSMRKA